MWVYTYIFSKCAIILCGVWSYCNRIPRRCIIILWFTSFHHAHTKLQQHRDIKFQFRDSEMKHDYFARFGSIQSKSGHQTKSGKIVRKRETTHRQDFKQFPHPTTGKMHLFTDNPFEQWKKCFINLRSNTLCRLPLPPFYLVAKNSSFACMMAAEGLIVGLLTRRI